MLNNNKIKFALSLIIAIIIWGYVMIETNPIETRTIKDVAITYLNEDNLEQDGLALLFKGSDSLSVTIEGNRSDVNAIDKKDIVATVDLSDAVEGENNLRVTVHVPDSVDFVSSSPSKVTITTEVIDSREIAIYPYYLGMYDDENEPVTVEMSKTTVTVTGARSMIESVDHVNALVPEGVVTQELKTIKCELVPVDANGEEVRHIELEFDTINVMTEIAKTKTVSLEIPIIDNSGFTKDTSGPKTIVIKGMGSDVDKIKSITCQSIDLTDVKENTVMEVVPILPDGISVSEQSSDALLLVVTIPERVTKDFSFTEADIRISNLGSNKTATLEKGTYVVTVSGSQDIVDKITEEDIVLYVDLKKFSTGESKVSISATCDKNFEEIAVKPGKVKVTIKAKKKPTQNDDPDDNTSVDKDENLGANGDSAPENNQDSQQDDAGENTDDSVDEPVDAELNESLEGNQNDDDQRE